MMHVTDLALNQAMGLRLVPLGSDHILEMPETPLLLNHIGTIHAGAQFSLAEAASGEFLLRHLGDGQGQVLAVLRSSSMKYRKPAHGALRATAQFAGETAESLAGTLEKRGRALTTVLVEVADTQGIVTMTGRFDWFLQRAVE